MTHTHQGGPDTPTWDELYARWFAGGDRLGVHYRVIKVARKRVRDNSPGDWRWLRDGLSDPDKKYFIAEVFRFQPVAKRLVPAMIRAGVLERDPSFNRYFIEPCVRSFGAESVLHELLRYLESGTDEEKGGAASALYWAAGRSEETPQVSRLLWRIQEQMLREFVANPNLYVRRRLIPMLSLKPERYGEELRPLIGRAVEIARAHPDEYIRHRIEIQLGAGGPYMAIPDEEPRPERQSKMGLLRRVLYGLMRLIPPL